MRKITILLALIGLSVFVFGQKPRNLKDELNAKSRRNGPSMQSHGKGIAAEVLPLSKYKAGATMDIVFTLTITTPDWEWVDYFELTFPNGMKPIDGSDPFMDTQDPDAISIDGQVVSWGTDNNDELGGIEHGTHEFFVTVEIDNTVSGDKTIPYKVSGDYYGASDPHDVSGIATLKQLPNVPDLAIKPAGFIAEYYAVPLDQVIEFSQVTSTIQALVTNLGAELTQATNAKAASAGDYMDEAAITVPLDSYEEIQVVFADFKTTKVGIETFTFTANASNDFDTENGTVEAQIEISETDLIRDNGEILGGFSLGGPGYLGNVFTVNSKDTLNSVTVYLTGPTIGDVLFVDVFEVLEDGSIGEKVAGSVAMAITASEGEFTAYFAGEGVILEAGKYLFAVKEDANYITLAVTSDEYVDGTAWAELGNGWLDIGQFGFPYTFYIRPGFGTELPAFDMAFYALDIYKYAVKGNDLTVEGTLLNKGVEALNSIDISYTVNGGTPVTESFTDLNAYGLINFSLTTLVDIAATGDYHVKVYFTNPNGADDADVSNDTIEMMVSALEYAPHKNIVGEEATGTWCGWCVRGAVFMEYMEENYQDTWIGIAVHNYDPMVVDEYDAGIGNYIPGYPSGLVNRMGVFDPMEFEDAHNALIDLPSPVGVEISNVSLDAGTGELTFDVSAEFLATLKDARFNAVIIENNVTGDGDGYNQANYYSGGASGEMGGYEDKPDPVLAEDMVYQNVARAILGGWDGTAGSLPATVNAGEVKTYTYSITLEAEWNVDEIKIIGMVIGDDGSILNAAQVTIPAPVALPLDFETPVAFNSWSSVTTIIPNPNSGGINTSANVAQHVKEAGNAWAGVIIELDDFIDFSVNTEFSMKVFSPAANTPVLFKVEADGVPAKEVMANTTKANEWETLTFDFTGTTSDVFKKLVLFFNAGVDGAGTYLFDDIYLLPGSGVNEMNLNAISITPNPFSSELIINNAEGAKQIVISNLLGQNIMTVNEIANRQVISTDRLNKGVYFVTIIDQNNNRRIERVVKQ